MGKGGRKPSDATRLGRLMRLAGVPAGEVAAAAGVSTRTLSDWTSGKRMPSLQQQRALEQHFGFPPGKIFGPDGLRDAGTAEAP